MSIVYAAEPSLSVADYIAVVGSTYMRDKRPLSNRARVESMLRGSNMIVCAREDGEIVGILRGLSDGEWVCYVADLVVHEGHQRKGIGQGLLDECRRRLGPGMALVLVAYPEAESFYRRVGMSGMPAFYFDREIGN